MRRLFSLCTLLLAAVHIATAQSQADILAYVDKYKQIALDQERQYGIPAPITLAQGILESGAGKSGLTRNSNNHFGVKALGGWNGGVYKAWDDEPQKSSFRVYASAEESFRDHSLVLKNSSRYRSLFAKSIYDYRGWAIGLQKAGYATAKNYAAALIGFIDTYRLYAVNGGVKLRPGKTVIVTQTVNSGPTFDASCQMDEEEQSEEEQSVTKAVTRYVVEINDVSCTILYPGTTLAAIAMQYDIPRDKLLEFNEVVVEEELHEGDIIFLDRKKKKYEGAKDFHNVKNGETLYGIAQEYGIKLASLAKMNGMDISEKLYEGIKLRLK